MSIFLYKNVSSTKYKTLLCKMNFFMDFLWCDSHWGPILLLNKQKLISNSCRSNVRSTTILILWNIKLKILKKKPGDEEFRVSFKFLRCGWDQRLADFNTFANIETRSCYSCLVLYLHGYRFLSWFTGSSFLVWRSVFIQSMWNYFFFYETDVVLFYILFSKKCSHFKTTLTCFNRCY